MGNTHKVGLPQNLKELSCDGKVKHRSYYEAHKRLIAQSRVRKVGGRRKEARIVPYRCSYCHLFHIGNTRITL